MPTKSVYDLSFEEQVALVEANPRRHVIANLPSEERAGALAVNSDQTMVARGKVKAHR